jgi:glutamine synthetase
LTAAFGDTFVSYLTRIKQAEIDRHAEAEDKDDWQRREYFSRI